MFCITAICDHEIGLLLRHGRFERKLETGVHCLFGFGRKVLRYDLRRQALTVASQEIATKDPVAVKVTALVHYHITDAARMRLASTDALEEMYASVQLAMRRLVAGITLEELMARDGEMDERLAAALQSDADRLGLAIDQAAIKDVVLGRELKTALQEVVCARSEAQARMERARGDSAATRNQLNTARLFEQHTGLYQMRMLQALESAAENDSNTLVFGVRETGLIQHNNEKSDR